MIRKYLQQDKHLAGRTICFFCMVVALFVMMTGGCTLLRLQEDLETLSQMATIAGRVMGRPDSQHPVFAMVYNLKDGRPVLQSYWITYDSGAFDIPVPPGFYYLFAFEDKNEDAAFQPDEWCGWYGKPSPLLVGPGDKKAGIKLALRAPSEARMELSQLATPQVMSVPMTLQSRPVGEVIPLSAKRFGPEYAEKGLWEPIAFVKDPGAGLFFLEPYDSQKIPVLFIHGVAGYPRQWKGVIDSLDRSRFQPWVLQYPSGLRLGMLGEFLEKHLAELQVRYQFQRLFIVANSMGGLVARSAVNCQINNRPRVFIKLLITIATPWQGHPAALNGIKSSPVVVPSWYDMAPNSPFIKNLKKTTLPPDLDFYLLFGYRGGVNGKGELNDGTVLLSSVLDESMQQAATEIYGCDEGHRSIIDSSCIIDRVNQLLDQAASK